jgi:hypothetical protein
VLDDSAQSNSTIQQLTGFQIFGGNTREKELVWVSAREAESQDSERMHQILSMFTEQGYGAPRQLSERESELEESKRNYCRKYR